MSFIRERNSEMGSCHSARTNSIGIFFDNIFKCARRFGSFIWSTYIPDNLATDTNERLIWTGLILLLLLSQIMRMLTLIFKLEQTNYWKTHLLKMYCSSLGACISNSTCFIGWMFMSLCHSSAYEYVSELSECI